MDVGEEGGLIAKIEQLSPEQRERVEGHVDALHGTAQPYSAVGELTYGSEREEQASEPTFSEESIDTDEETLDLSLRGDLSHLRDEYTAEELQEKAKQWRIKKALDY
jgi:hypothetical protein